MTFVAFRFPPMEIPSLQRAAMVPFGSGTSRKDVGIESGRHTTASWSARLQFHLTGKVCSLLGQMELLQSRGSYDSVPQIGQCVDRAMTRR